MHRFPSREAFGETVGSDRARSSFGYLFPPTAVFDMAGLSESISKHWTPRRCYTAAAIVLVMGFVLFILLTALVVSSASEELALRTAKCTVVESSVLPEEKFVECQCGVTCQSFYPCLKIFVDYFPEDGVIGIQRRQLLHYSLNEEAQNTEVRFY